MRELALVILLMSIMTSCSNSGPEPINYSRDQCAYCMMSISDQKFGAELVTDKGRILKYDAAECLAAHLSDGAPLHQTLLAVPYDSPGSLIKVEDLNFLISTEFTSPMGANLVAWSEEGNVPEKHRSDLLNWEEVMKRLAD